MLFCNSVLNIVQRCSTFSLCILLIRLHISICCRFHCERLDIQCGTIGCRYGYHKSLLDGPMCLVYHMFRIYDVVLSFVIGPGFVLVSFDAISIGLLRATVVYVLLMVVFYAER